ncbi:hypothetical protein HYH03_004189 [Edaphochlamys debaryana]|uniref:Cytochrome P450 n=1 Tax=Edaphochlamys debaryana TaxID=47281 RepID=A0A835Y7Y2_9CHLO|nr:hypothetical protein HYH03_004189 [Edaphochlamys debaryana]|eukprot:KAG2497927.1 hypothetical protein HYH03_004189 [Edaphochlamys debaryana]
MPVATFTSLMGPHFLQEPREVHGPWRKVMLAAAGPGPGMASLVPGVREVMGRHVAAWEAAGRVELYDSARRMGLDLSVDVLTGVTQAGLTEGTIDMGWFKDQMGIFLHGLYGLPLPLPGSPLAKGLAAKEAILSRLEPLFRDKHERFAKEWAALGGSASAMAARLTEGPAPPTLEQGYQLGFQAKGMTTLRDTATSVLHSVMAAADTTRFALLHTWVLLAMSPRVQEECFKEQQKVIAEYGDEISYKAVMNMPYLEATFKECLRLFPPSSGGFRLLTRDVSVGGQTLPAGTTVWYHALLLQMLDPVLWDGRTDYDLPPHMDWKGNFEGAFKPERWLSDDTKPRHFYVFGSGAHLCAGMQLTTLEVKMLLAMLVRRFVMQLEVPDMLNKASVFPYTVPAKGTDGLRLVPREQPLPW